MLKYKIKIHEKQKSIEWFWVFRIGWSTTKCSQNVNRMQSAKPNIHINDKCLVCICFDVFGECSIEDLMTFYSNLIFVQSSVQYTVCLFLCRKHLSLIPMRQTIFMEILGIWYTKMNFYRKQLELKLPKRNPITCIV